MLLLFLLLLLLIRLKAMVELVIGFNYLKWGGENVMGELWKWENCLVVCAKLEDLVTIFKFNLKYGSIWRVSYLHSLSLSLCFTWIHRFHVIQIIHKLFLWYESSVSPSHVRSHARTYRAPYCNQYLTCDENPKRISADFLYFINRTCKLWNG